MAGVRFAQVKAPNFAVALTDWLQPLLIVLRIKQDEELTRNGKQRESNMSVPRMPILSAGEIGKAGGGALFRSHFSPDSLTLLRLWALPGHLRTFCWDAYRSMPDMIPFRANYRPKPLILK